MWDPLPGRCFNADQMADVCFCDLYGGNMNKLRGSIHPPLCMQHLLQRQAPHLCPGGYSWVLLTFIQGEGTTVLGAGQSHPVSNLPEAMGGVKDLTATWHWYQQLAGERRDLVGCWRGWKAAMLLQCCCCPADRYQPE